MNIPGSQNVKSIFYKIGITEYLRHIDRLFSKYYPLIVSLGGPGEPTDNPYFVDIANYFIDNGNKLKIFTNLEHRYKLFELKNLQGVQLAASFHYDNYLRGRKFDLHNWQENIYALYEQGVDIDVLITPLSPLVLANADKYLEIVRSIKDYITCIYPSQMYHIYEGKEYPQSYTEKESEQVKEIINEFYKSDFEDVRDERNSYKSKGDLCSVFNQVAVVTIDGDIIFCQSDPQFILGNIETFEGEIYSEYKPCPADNCLCQGFYKKYRL